MEAVPAALILQVIDFLFAGETCTSAVFCVAPRCDRVIYGPPVAAASDLYNDTKPTEPVLALPTLKEQFRPAK